MSNLVELQYNENCLKGGSTPSQTPSQADYDEFVAASHQSNDCPPLSTGTMAQIINVFRQLTPGTGISQDAINESLRIFNGLNAACMRRK